MPATVEKTKRCHYEVLGVKRTADEAAIRAAYRNLSRKAHPDAHLDPRAKAIAEENFKDLNEAKEVLTNFDNRAAYDRWGHGWKGKSNSYNRSSGGGYSSGQGYNGGHSYAGYESYIKNVRNTELGGMFTLAGSMFVSNANENIRHKKERREDITWVDRTYQVGTIALTAGAILFTAHSMGAINLKGVASAFGRA